VVRAQGSRKRKEQWKQHKSLIFLKKRKSNLPLFYCIKFLATLLSALFLIPLYS
jgi:hypothetical protein